MAEKLRKGYRIPTIDEFVDGFEFEVYSEGCWEDSVEDFCGWYKYKFGYNNWRDIEDIERELQLGNIQVWFGLEIEPSQQEKKELCRKLRIETGMGIMRCKVCLEKYSWNYNDAKENFKQFKWDGKLKNK